MLNKCTFQNVAPTDFAISSNREAFAKGVSWASKQLSKVPQIIRPLISGKEKRLDSEIFHYNPSNPKQMIAKIEVSGLEEVKVSLEGLKKFAPSWKDIAISERAEILRKAAAIMEERRFELAGIILKEVAKPWVEADADVVEAIDFCRYYADEAEKLFSPLALQKVMGETNLLYHLPRGLAVVISPWNFPLAIACGMLSAALVTGNVAILKPAEQSSWIAREFIKILFEAGLPPEALVFLPGRGEEVGAALVRSTEVDLICFTGSKAVGLDIIYEAGILRPGQAGIKKVIAEMGGKNAIIVDEDADLDEAIKGILYSAFGFAGQKCSACSRLIAVGTVYELLMERLGAAASDLIIGPPEASASFLGPVIDETSFNRLNKFLETAASTHQLAFKGKVPADGYYVPPHVFKDVPETSELWCEELFGPVLACQSVKTFEAAISLANNSQYALTGGLYSRSPSNIEFAKRHLEVGNLYINRGCTGAIVGRHPFGGYRLSGIGEKAGGPDYLQQFVHSRTVSENTMRKGFTPELAVE